jgi:hypothetical protein
LNDLDVHTPEWESLAAEIYKRYLQPYSPQRVNLTRTKIPAWQQVSASLFNAIQTEVNQRLESVYTEFTKHAIFRQMIESLQIHQALTGQLEGSSLIYALWQKMGFGKPKLRYEYISIA